MRRYGGALALAGVAFLLVACTSAPPATQRASDVAGGSGPSPTTSQSSSPTVSPRTKALAEAERLLGLIRVPTGSAIAASAPVPALQRPPESPSSPYLLSVHRWWSTPLSPSSTLASLRAHPPAGLRLRGSGSGTSAGGATITYLIFEGRPTRDYNYATLLVTTASDGQGSGIRADGQVLWVPLRTTSEEVPPGVRHVALLAYRRNPSHVLAHVSLSGADAKRLARLANDLPRDNRGFHSCVFDTGFKIRMTFPTPEGRLVFTVWPACGSVLVSANGVSQPSLAIQPPLATHPPLVDVLTHYLGPRHVAF